MTEAGKVSRLQILTASPKPERARPNKKTARRRSPQHQVSVRREAVHIRTSRFELIEMVQTYLSELNGRLLMKRQMISALVTIALVPHHSDYDWLILSQFRMGRSCGATRIWMLRATLG
jgi:hypothetical protein